MDPRNLSIGGLSIAIRDTGTRGPAIVLVHGNSTSTRAFEPQLTGVLGQTHRLVAIDLPGHGASSRARTPSETYTLPGYARILVEAARCLDLDGAIFFGWSLGGHVVLEASGALPRAAGFAILGTPPLGFPPAWDRAFVQAPTLGVAFREDSSEAEIREYQRTLFKPDAAAPEVFAEDFRRTDGRARSAIAASVRPGGYLDELEILAHLAAPLAVLHGEHDRIVNGAYLEGLPGARLWRRSIQVIPGAGHAAHWEAPAAFDELLAAFARDCSRDP